jgi:SAM-dependent methyltransferase
VDREYGARYRDLFERHWWWRARTKYIIETLRRYRPLDGWSSILDIGCGDGLLFEHLKEFGNVEGVEPSAELVNPNNPDRARIHICSFEQFAPPKRYSLLLMLDVLEHLADAARALGHATDLLEADGILIATVPAFMALWTNHDVLNHHFARYTRRSFRQVAKSARLEIVEERYLYHWTFPAKVGVRVVERALHLKPKPPIVRAGWMNKLLYGISRLEQVSLTRLPVPFGSSLMVVARRAAKSANGNIAARVRDKAADAHQIV